jgi:hypothetical protein
VGVILDTHEFAWDAVLRPEGRALLLAQRVLVDADGILVGTSSYNADSGRNLLLTCRLHGGLVFADGFEGN